MEQSVGSKNIYKVVLIGDSSVGKTSIVTRVLKDRFDDAEKPTIGACFSPFPLFIDDTEVTFHIWDTWGGEKFRSLGPLFYRDTDAAIVVYDVNNYESFINCDYWIRQLKDNLGEELIIALVGNKIDLKQSIKVPKDYGEIYAKNNKLIFYEASAKDGRNSTEIFMSIGKELLKSNIKRQNIKDRGTIKLNADNNEENILKRICFCN